MQQYFRSAHWRGVPWLVGFVLILDLVGRGHADLGELTVFGLGTLAVSAVCIAIYDVLDHVRVGGRRQF